MSQSSPPSIVTRLTRDYGLRHPFACAGLAFAGTMPPLAIAVANAGGLGAIGIGKMPPPALAQVTDAYRAATDGPLNLNFITIFTTDDHIAACAELRPAVVSFHWGHPPRNWIDTLHAAGIRVWEQVGNVEDARRAVADGVDAVIAQGSESGGHNYGALPTFVLLPQIIDAIAPAMVLAAGGVMDGRGVAAALALGADGVWVGTRMAATREADIAQGYKDRMVAARSEDSVLSSLFGRDTADFNPMRVLRNAIVDEWQGREDTAPADPENQPEVGQMDFVGMTMPLHRFSNLVPVGSATGDLEQMPLLAGQGVGMVRDIPTVAEVIDRMMGEAQGVIARLAAANGKAA